VINLDNIELKPCAHCGSTNVSLSRSIIGNAICWRVECVDCSMQTASYVEDTREHPILEAMEGAIECAVNTWNARVEPNDDTNDDTKADEGKDDA